MRTNKKRIIGFVCTSFDNVAGGLERQIIRTSKSLYFKGFKIYVFSFDNNLAKSFYQIPDEIEWVKCGNGLEPHKKANKYGRLKQILLLRKKIKEYNITHLVTFTLCLKLSESFYAGCTMFGFTLLLGSL